jgi:hypothetical protein
MEATIHDIELKLVAIEKTQEQQTQTLNEIKDMMKCVKSSTTYEFLCERFPTVDSFIEAKTEIADLKSATKYETLSKVYVTIKEFIFIRWAVYTMTGAFVLGIIAAMLKLVLGPMPSK